MLICFLTDIKGDIAKVANWLETRSNLERLSILEPLHLQIGIAYRFHFALKMGSLLLL